MLDVVAIDRPRATARLTRAALAGWFALVLVAVVWGRYVGSHASLALQSPPFWSPYEPHLSYRIVPAIAIAALVIGFGPRCAHAMRWRAVLVATGATTLAWAVAMAYVDNLHGLIALTDPLSFHRNDYWQTARAITSLHDFLAHLPDRIDTYNQHTMGHPPGMVVIERVLDRAGFATQGWSAALVLAGGVSAVLAVMVAVREVAGEHHARAAAPFLVLTPAVIWWQSADAFYAGVSAWAITLVVLATGRRDRLGDLFALGGGFLFGVTAFLSYGLVLLALVPGVVGASRRRARPLALAAVGAMPVFAWFAAMGFSWLAGFAATRRVYWDGVASRRPYRYFVFADLALFAIATGPAVSVALARLRDRKLWLLVGAVLAVVAIADLSGMSKAEVERIWLPFVPWAVAATAVLTPAERPAAARPWLALQVACSLVVAVTIWSLW